MLAKLFEAKSTSRQQIIVTLALFVIAIALSLVLPSMVGSIFPSEIIINLFKIIPITRWLELLILSILLNGLIRAYLICLVSKTGFRFNYLNVFFKVIQFSVMGIPLAMAILPIYFNWIVVSKNGLTDEVTLHKSLSAGYCLCFLLLTVMWGGLGFTLKRFLKLRMKKSWAFAVNIMSGFSTGFVVGAFTFIGINIHQYEIVYVHELLNLKVKYGKISVIQSETLMNQYIIKYRPQ